MLKLAKMMYICRPRFCLSLKYVNGGWHFVIFTYKQGFMQDKIIASHTCFGGHMDVNC